MNKRIVSWTEFDTLMEQLLKKVDRKILSYNCLLMIGRGGLVVGTWLRHRLKLPIAVLLSKTTKFSPWDIQVKVTDLVDFGDVDFSSGYVLVVDEIVDSGSTKKAVVKKLHLPEKQIKFASLFVNDKNCPKDCYPDFYVEKTDQWVVFPWEKSEVVEEVRCVQ